MTSSIIFVILFVILAIVFLAGKGDMLIAGYNTASEEERNQVDIRRLRLLMAIVSVLTAVFCGVMPLIGNNVTHQLMATGMFMLTIIFFIILANTWAKKNRTDKQ